MSRGHGDATVAIVSLGCVKNLVDSETMAGILHARGFRLTTDEDRADVVIVNTCGFIAPAQRESIDAILARAGRTARQHEERGRQRLVVSGCLPRRFDVEQVAEQLPEVDAVIGTAEVPLIADVVESVLEGRRVVLAEQAPSFLYHERLPRLRSTPSHLAYVKISEGCQHPCTFCTIPSIRGPHRSRPIESIVEEVRALAEQGVDEVGLIGQDTSLYGADLYGRLALPELLRALGSTDVRWIRLMYAYPANVTEELIGAMASVPQVCPYLDLPLQHASDRILKAMGRWGSREIYERLVARVRRGIPGIALRTTFIVGFPGETEQDVEDLIAFVEEVGFDHVGVFTYSREEGTPAARLPGQVPEAEKRRRRAAVMERQQQVLGRVMESRLGSEVPVVLERKAGTGEWVGRSVYQAPEVDGVTWVKLDGPAAAGQWMQVRLVAIRGYDFAGEPGGAGSGKPAMV